MSLRTVDAALSTIADYVTNPAPLSKLAYTTARYCLMDALGCAILALQYPACTKLLGPIVPNTTIPHGARVPGTNYVLDPIQAAFNIGTLIRWLDFNDTWLAAEWGHPSDNLGAILACADYQSQQCARQGKKPLHMKDVFTAMIKAYEIQGILALANSFNRYGWDHVILVRLASTAVATALLDGTPEQITAALSQAFIDGATLRIYRHAPNTGSRKSWAAGDATSRAVRLAWLTMQGERGCPTPLTTPHWGFNDVILHGNPLQFVKPFTSYVMENILFKVAYPAEFHAQTAVECAIQLHAQVKNRLAEIEKIILKTQEPALRIINKQGVLHNPADRDHCLQYIVAVALLQGDLTAADYENAFAADPRIDQLREKMLVEEEKEFSRDYLDPDKRAIANAIQIFFRDGTKTENVTVVYPLGHPKRREEGIPLLIKKFEQNMAAHFSDKKIKYFMELFQKGEVLDAMPVNVFMEEFHS